MFVNIESGPESSEDKRPKKRPISACLSGPGYGGPGRKKGLPLPPPHTPMSPCERMWRLEEGRNQMASSHWAKQWDFSLGGGAEVRQMVGTNEGHAAPFCGSAWQCGGPGRAKWHRRNHIYTLVETTIPQRPPKQTEPE